MSSFGGSFRAWANSASFVRFRRGLCALAAGLFAADYYGCWHYHAFDPSEGVPYIVDWTPIGRPRALLLTEPSAFHTSYSPFGPRNGDVVIARDVPGTANYMQLLSGRYVEKQTCGIPLMRPLAEVEAERRQQATHEAELREMLSQRHTPETEPSTTVVPQPQQ